MGTWWSFRSGNSYFFNSSNVYWILSLTVPLSLVSFFLSFWNPYYMDLLGYFSNFFHLFSPIYPPLCLFILVPKRFLQDSSYSTVVFIFAITFSISNSSFFLWILLFIQHSVLFSGLQYLLSLWIFIENFLPPSASVLQIFFSLHSLFPPSCIFFCTFGFCMVFLIRTFPQMSGNPWPSAPLRIRELKCWLEALCAQVGLADYKEFHYILRSDCTLWLENSNITVFRSFLR